MKAFREARRSAFCRGILAVWAATASSSATAELRGWVNGERGFWLSLAINQQRLDAHIAIFVQNRATDLATNTLGRRFLYGNEGRKLDRMAKLARLQTFGVLCLAARHLMSASKPEL